MQYIYIYCVFLKFVSEIKSSNYVNKPFCFYLFIKNCTEIPNNASYHQNSSIEVARSRGCVGPRKKRDAKFDLKSEDPLLPPSCPTRYASNLTLHKDQKHKCFPNLLLYYY